MRVRKLSWLCVVWIAITLLIRLVLFADSTEDYVPDATYIQVQGELYKKEETQDSKVLYLRNLRICSRKGQEHLEGNVPVYLAKEFAGLLPELGQTVQVSGSVKTIQNAQNPGNFNQKSYNEQQHIYWILQQAEVTGYGGKTNVFLETLWKFRQNCCKRILTYMNQRQGGILCAMLLGDASYMDAEVKEQYQKTGIGHLYAVSSLHMNFWGLGVYQVLQKLRCPKKTAVVFAIGFLGIYVVLAGMSVSAVRSFFMFTIRMGAILCGREYDGLTAVSVSLALQLTKQPKRIWNVGFQLSYGAVLGIYLLGPVLKEKAGEKMGTPLAVHLALLPVMLYSYYEVCPYSFAWNLLAIPFASLIMSCGMLGLFFPGLFIVPKLILLFYEKGNVWILGLPAARLVIGQPKLWQILLFYICLGYILNILAKGKGTAKAAMVIVAGTLVLCMPQQIHRELKITMLNVGQGDCFFLQLPAGETCLIDGGSSNVNKVGQYRIEPYLKWAGAGTLDYVFVSHGDTDHINGIMELMERELTGIHIKRLILPSRKVWDEQLEQLAETAKMHGISVYEMKQGNIIHIQKVQIECLWPSDELVEAGNESSLVVSVSYKDFDGLFTGDLEGDCERALCNQLKTKKTDYEVLKVGHHGSRNGTSENLLNQCKPEVALISAGAGNQYGHPHEEVVSRLAKHGINRYNTLDGSAVTICTDGEKYYILEP